MHIYTHDINTIVIDYERQCMNGVIKIPYRGIFPRKKFHENHLSIYLQGKKFYIFVN